MQARAHARAIPCVRAVREIRVVGRDGQKVQALARDIQQEQGLLALPAASFREAAAGASIICATTHAAEPVVIGKWVEPGTHLTSVGVNPHGRELDSDTVVKSLVVVESRQAVLAPPPSGTNDLRIPLQEGVISEQHLLAEIGDLLSGQRAGRTSSEQITLYKSVGVAVQDAVAAQLILDAARQQGAGIEMAL